LLAKLPIPRRLRDSGVGRGDLDAIAQAAMSDWFISRGARKVSHAAEVRAILDAAWWRARPFLANNGAGPANARMVESLSV
jgi:hypothetical protein